MIARTVLLLLAIFSTLGQSDRAVETFKTWIEWNYVNFTWPSASLMDELNYNPGAYIPVGIKIHQSSNRIFISLPRVKESARITLATIPLDQKRKNPLLTPYPSWKMNTGSNCDSLQDVMSMEIDRDDVMWVVDARRVSSVVTCPPKLVLIDLKNDEILQKYEVPDSLCPHKNGCFLNDIVVHGDYAYFSDTTKSDPGIFVYNRKLNKSWKIRNNETMWGDLDASGFTAQGETLTGVSHINGIALSPSCPSSKYFYYTPQTSFHIYSIPTEILKTELASRKQLNNCNVKNVISKSGATGGMVGDSTGNIYLGILPEDSVVVANPTNGTVKVIEQNSDIIKWPDTFAFDKNGYLYVTATQILRFTNKGLNPKDVNFRILKLYTGTRSYFYCDNSD
ncbi:hypothetical protein JTB14_025510 [Gonioctena quinquepunctata]|nr:hypothetical protein JTB14_025510 [Gonioctena quinquepunctata]